MKSLLFFFCVSCTMLSCKAQTDHAIEDQQLTNSQLAELKAKGQIPSAAGGWTMTATIDGKPWKATSLFPPELSGRIIGYYKDGYIGLPYPGQSMQVGHKETLGNGNAVDFAAVGEADVWGGRTGSMLITKVSGNWVEGKFSFTAKLQGSDRRIEVTNGFFRISTKPH